MSAQYDEARLNAAIDALADRERFREAEMLVAGAAPRLQHVLAHALEAGGWFDDAHDAELRRAASAPDEAERVTALRTMFAEEARIGMMVGVAVGWALRDELDRDAPDTDQEE